MIPLPKVVWISLLGATFVASALPNSAQAQNAQIRHVAVKSSGGSTEIEIETSRRLVPMTQILTDPDRLVIDFPDALPGPDLRAVTVNQGEVKSVRTSLFSSNPSMTRVVVELKSAADFHLFPSSHSIVLKFEGASSTAVEANAPTPPTTPTPALSVRPASSTPTAEASAPAQVISPAPQPAPSPVEKTMIANSGAPRAVSAPVAPPANLPRLKATETVTAPKEPERTPARVSLARTTVVSATPSAVGPNPQIQRLGVLKSGGTTEIEIEASEHLVPEVQMVTGPDRLVIDFPKALPGPQLRAVPVNQGEVKGVRFGLLSAKPPVTRVVVDLKSPQAYQLFPSGRSVIVKVGGAPVPETPAATTAPPAGTPDAAPAQENAPAAPEPVKKVAVFFQDGLLTVTSRKGVLSDILNEIRAQTGADITIPAGAEQEEVVASIGPAPAKEAVAQLLNGSRYNFIILGSDSDASKLAKVILSPKGSGEFPVDTPQPPEPVPVAQAQTQDRSVSTAPPPPPPTPEEQPQGDSIPPDTTPQPGDPQPAPN